MSSWGIAPMIFVALKRLLHPLSYGHLAANTQPSLSNCSPAPDEEKPKPCNKIWLLHHNPQPHGGTGERKNGGGDRNNHSTFCDRPYTSEEILHFINHYDLLRLCKCYDIRLQVEEPYFSQCLLFSQTNPALFGEHFKTFRPAQRAVQTNW